MSTLKLCLVGGFLGSGKTTAILEATKYLYTSGKKVGVITNDQGTQQVDSLFIKSHDISLRRGVWWLLLLQLTKTLKKAFTL